MASKLGIHIDLVTYQGQMQQMIDAKPAVIKVVGGRGAMRILRNSLPDTVFIARNASTELAGDDFLRFKGSDSPIAAAYRWFNVMSSALRELPFAYHESFNEMSNWAALRDYAVFERERQHIMADNGYKCCIGNFATGTPEIADIGDVWSEFYPALSLAHQLGNVLGLHEYGGLYLSTWYGNNTHERMLDRDFDITPASYAEGWLFGRYRKVWRRHIKPAGWSNIKLVITEFGLDNAGTITTEKLAGKPVGAWQQCREAWLRLNGRNDAEQFYFEQLVWADLQMQADPYVIGATIFTHGTMSNVWREFDIHGSVANKVYAHIKASANVVPAPPASSPAPVPNPIPEPAPLTWGSFGTYVSPLPTITRGLNVRSVPIIAAGNILTLVYPNNKLLVLDGVANIGTVNEWLKVLMANNTVGYVAAWGVQQVDEPNPLFVKATYSGGVFVRSGPGTSYPALGAIYPKDQVRVVTDQENVLAKLGEDNYWANILTPGGKTGWSYTKYLTLWKSPPVTTPPAATVISPVGHALVGLHGPADPAMWAWSSAAYNVVSLGRIEAVKVLASGDIDGSIVGKLTTRGVKFVMARLFYKFHSKTTPAQFVEAVLPSALSLYNAGVRYFEVHNEPNLHTTGAPEGMWLNWQNGNEFGLWFRGVIELLRPLMPQAKFGWPGLSPGSEMPNARYDAAKFMSEAITHINIAADFVGVHTYWNNHNIYWINALDNVRQFAQLWPKKLVLVTEFSNTNATIPKDVKAREYVQFYKYAHTLPANVGALFSFVLSASSGFGSEAWLGSFIPTIVGGRE